MEFNVHNLVKWFQLSYPELVKSMKACNHHYSEEELNPYHLESDVFTHNMMVVLEASKDKSPSKDFYKHLLVCALLHDIGKPIARKENHEKKRVNFYGHEPMSAFFAVHIIEHIEKDFNLSFNRRLILEAIAMHTEVFKVEESKLLDRLINNKTLALLLSRLSKADYHGRFYDMGDRITSDMIPASKNTLANKDKHIMLYVGLPCSGKSTAIKKKIQEGWVSLSSDDVVEQLGLEMGITNYNEAFSKVNRDEVGKILTARKKQYIKDGKDIVVDMTNMSRKARKKMLQDFPPNYMRSAHVMMTSINNIMSRNIQRDGKCIPQHVYENMAMAFYPPLYDEFDVIDWEFN